MIIIFQCFGGTHTSVTAASIYLGKLPRSRIPRLEELLDLPHFDRVENADIGTLNYLGRDRLGNRVFALGSGRWGAAIRELLPPLLQLYGPKVPALALIDCSSAVTWPVRLGGFLSRRLHCIDPGRPLVGWGILRNYRRLLQLVEHFEADPARYLL